jgi:hypothetical protein
VGDTFNFPCNFLYCNRRVHRGFLIILYNLPLAVMQMRTRKQLVYRLHCVYLTRYLGSVVTLCHCFKELIIKTISSHKFHINICRIRKYFRDCDIIKSFTRRKDIFKIRLDPRPVCVGIVLDEIALGKDFLHVLLLSRLSSIPSMLHTHTAKAI